MYSKDDLRWQMYADTLPMIRDHLFFGVGLGGWLQAYGPYASPAMSGLNPVFLHNDPEQFLSELGILGALPIILLILSLGRLAIAKRAALPPEIAQRLTFRVCGLAGFLVASFLDFPFHIPSIQITLAVLLGLTVFDIESPDQTLSSSL
jgi:O-antigen ligase